jgi:hypothetical protein
MKIYLASGFSVMNVKGRERELFLKYSKQYNWNRLISFYDAIFTKNNIQAVLDLKKKR